MPGPRFPSLRFGIEPIRSPEDTMVVLDALFTPIHSCVTLGIGDLDSTLIHALRDSQYDQAPVRNHFGDVVGIISTERAAELQRQEVLLMEDDPSISKVYLPVQVPLLSVLSTLAEHSAVLVRSMQDSEKSSSVEGLMTLADLNWHPFRAVLYPFLAALETAFATMIRKHFDRPLEWIRELPDRDQVEVLGRWDVAKAKNVHTDPVAGTMLRHLLTAVQFSKGQLGTKMRTKLTPSGTTFRASAKSINDMRNRIMHAVKPLVGNRQDVQKLSSVLTQIWWMTVTAAELAGLDET